MAKKTYDVDRDDLVRIESGKCTKETLSWCSDMNDWIGREVKVSNYYPYNNYTQLIGVPYSFHAGDLKILKKDPKPDWYKKVKKMIVQGSGGHELNYRVYDSEEKRTHNTHWTRSGGCFQSYNSSLRNFYESYAYYPNRLNWEFMNEPNPSGSFKEFKQAKSTLKWWFKMWKGYGIFGKNVKIDDLMNGKLDMKIRKSSEPACIPPNHIYVPVCVCRYVYEQPDTIKMTHYLVTKEGMNFWNAFAFTQIGCYNGRGHAILSNYTIPNQYGNEPQAWKMAYLARNIAKYWLEMKDSDRNTTIFSWWATMRSVVSLEASKKEMKALSKVKFLTDLEKYNPEEGVYEAS